MTRLLITYGNWLIWWSVRHFLVSHDGSPSCPITDQASKKHLTGRCSINLDVEEHLHTKYVSPQRGCDL